jgi:hypothetical protein
MGPELNIVFDNWNSNNEPIKNMSHLDDKYGNDTVTYPFFLQELNIKYWKINKCKLSNISSTKSFYYIISHVYEYSFFIKNAKLDLPKDILYHITYSNLKIIFIASHESPEHLDIFVKLLTETIIKNNWKEENFYIISNNSMIYNVKNKLNSNINFFKINSLLNLVSSQIKIKPNISDIFYDKKFIFLCQNRQPHFHRIVLLTHLKNLKLLDNDIIDWSLVIDYSTYAANKKDIQSIGHLKGYIDPTNKELVNDYKIITSTKKLSYYEQNVDWFDNVQKYIQLEHLTLESYKNSYINIVADSHYYFRENDVHITEKSFKPFYYFQIPIFLASFNHVKMIKEEYGFDLFDDLIDHSYDNERDDIKRFHMVVNEIKRLSTMREEIVQYYKNNIDKIIHNHNFVKNYPKKKIDENYFVKL